MLVVAGPSAGQHIFNPKRDLSEMQFLLPWDGPGAALFNPAFLAETQQTYGIAGSYSPTNEGEWLHPVDFSGGAPFMRIDDLHAMGQLSARIMPNLFLGLHWHGSGIAIDGSVAIFEKGTLTPSLAYRIYLGQDQSIPLSLGVAIPTHAFNAFGAVLSNSTSLDLGLLTAIPTRAMGRFKFGLALQNLIPVEAKLPDNNGSYEVHPWTADASVLWTVPGGELDVFVKAGAEKERDCSESCPNRGDFWVGLRVGDNRLVNLDIRNYGLEYRPLPWLGLKLEEPWSEQYLVWGSVFRLKPILGIDIEVELNLAHPKLLDPRPDSFREGADDIGFHHSFRVSGGF